MVAKVVAYFVDARTRDMVSSDPESTSLNSKYGNDFEQCQKSGKVIRRVAELRASGPVPQGWFYAATLLVFGAMPCGYCALHALGFFDRGEDKVEPVGQNPFAPKVLPMSSG